MARAISGAIDSTFSLSKRFSCGTGSVLVMITSRTAEKHRRYAQEIGVDVYLGKPYNEDELLGTLQRLIGARAANMAGSVAQMLGDQPEA